MKNIRSKREKFQLKREREILLRLKHPNIVNLLKVVDDEKRGKTYMMFDYVSGGELFDYIVAHGRLAERDARKFMRQVFSRPIPNYHLSSFIISTLWLKIISFVRLSQPLSSATR